MEAIIGGIIDFFRGLMPHPVGEKNNLRDILIVFGLFVLTIIGVLIYFFVIK